jgi:hypothetical protein
VRVSARAALLSLAVLAFAPGCFGVSMSSAMRRAVAPPAPSPNESLVVFMRPTEAFACCQASVFELRDAAADQLVGIVAPYTKVAYRTTPGRHFFMVVGEDASFLRAELLPGKTYHVRIYTFEGQGVKARYELKPVRRSELDSGAFRALDAGDWIENTPDSFAWADEHRDELQQKKAERLRIWLDARDDPSAALHPDDGI